MNLEIKDNQICLDRPKNELDKFVIKFIKTLKCNYVLVSGYISILFGRTRTTEDVDMLIEEIDSEKFKEIYHGLKKAGFKSVTIDDEKELFDELDKEHGSIRFCEGDKFIPNMEVKFAKNIVDKSAINNSLNVLFGKDKLRISPIELQIAYKLYLGKKGNEKDIEDARHLYKLFESSLDKQKLNEWLRHFKITEMVKYLEK